MIFRPLPDLANPPETRGDLLYNAKWRATLLVALPIGFAAFIAAWLLEGPSGQATRLDAIMYPILALSLTVLWGVLAASHHTLRFVLLCITAGVSAYFTGKLAWILFVLPQGPNIQAEMTENFFWVPVIYLLSFILPQVRAGRRITFGYTLVVLTIGTVYSVPNALQGTNLGIVGALLQMNLANTVFLALTSAFTHFREEHTRARTRMEETERSALTDHLTGLPNRLHLERHLEARLERARREGDGFALLFIDVDGFKVINDSLGHAGGDALLQRVSRRMRGSVRDFDFVARVSGDEFVMVLDRAATLADADRVARRVLTALADPFDVRGEALRVSLSIGIALYPDDAPDAETLMRRADSAMYRVKRSGRDGIRHYRHEPDGGSGRRSVLERDLWTASGNGELSLAYQSLHDLDSGALRGLEALVRWRHPRLGDVSPDEFVPTAEESGLIVEIGGWVLNEVCRQAKLWEDEGLDAFRVSINVSPLQFAHPAFVDTLLDALATHRLDPERLELELTETIVMQDMERVAATLVRLQELGIRIAIDDFGTGYSCLAYLRDLPIDTVKIDRSFVRDLGASREGSAFASALVEAIVSLAAHLDLEVVVEGIETAEQHERVRALGCRTGQGYLFSRPMAAGAVRAFLADATDVGAGEAVRV